VEYLRDAKYEAEGIDLATLDLRFVDDSNEEAYTTASSVELIRGGAQKVVTEENKAKYLELFVKHRLVAAIKPQVEAFRNGLVRKTRLFLSAFPIFVPSLSWQNDRFLYI
jgi:hypothetical protein